MVYFEWLAPYQLKKFDNPESDFGFVKFKLFLKYTFTSFRPLAALQQVSIFRLITGVNHKGYMVV
jgi:hypothetical protein